MLPKTSQTKLEPILGILIALLLLGIGQLIGFTSLQSLIGNKTTAFALSRFYYWICLLIILFYSLKIERTGLLLRKEEKYDIGKSVLLFLGIFTSMIFCSILAQLIIRIGSWQSTNTKLITILEILRNNPALILFTCATAGITEELICRGYIQTRLELYFEKPLMPILISSLIFGLAHFSWGTLINIMVPFLLGLVFGTFYWKFRNIKIIIACHFIWDLLAILIRLAMP